MFFLLYIGILIISYIITFKNEFTEEYIEKAGAVIFIISGIFIVLGIIGSLGGR